MCRMKSMCRKQFQAHVDVIVQKDLRKVKNITTKLCKNNNKP